VKVPAREGTFTGRTPFDVGAREVLATFVERFSEQHGVDKVAVMVAHATV
jgi:hypothetical protein